MRFRRTAEAEHVCFALLGKFCIICRVVVEVLSLGGLVDVVSRTSAAQILGGGGGFGTVLACALPLLLFAPARRLSSTAIPVLRNCQTHQTFARNLLTAVMRLPVWAWPLE